MGVILGEDEGLGQIGAARKHFGEHLVAERGQHGADLIRCHHVAVELRRIVGEDFVELLPPDFARLPVAFVHEEPGVHLRAALRYRGADAVDVATDIHAVGHGLFVVVFHDEVLLEETERLFRRRGSEADERGVEIFQHLSPEIVNGAMTFIRDDEIKFLDGKIGIVFDRDRFFEKRFGRFNGQVVEVGAGSFSPLSMEYARWMVPMTTRAELSSMLLVRCWTIYSSVNL